MNIRKALSNLTFLALLIISASFALRLDATLLIKLSLKDMTEKADAILIGRSVDIRSQWVGKKIFTYVTLSVDNYLKGDMGPTVVVTQLGGRVETPYPLEMHIPGSPVFGLGEKVIVFIAENSNGENQVLGWSQGKLSILKDRRTGKDIVIGSTASEAVADTQQAKLSTKISRPGRVYFTDFVEKVESLLGKSVVDNNRLIDGDELKEKLKLKRK